MDKLIVNSKYQTFLIDFEDIISFNAWGRYIKIITENENHTLCKNLGLLELGLPNYFFRIHDSYMINIRKISSIDGRMVNMVNGATYKIANNRRKNFKEYVENLCNHKQ